MHIDLTQDEHVVVSTRPHWKALVTPALVLILAAAGVGFALAWVPDHKSWSTAARYAAIAIGALAVIFWTIIPWIRWLTTHIVLTNERLITRVGVLKRTGRDIPLYRVNDVSFEQGIFDRMLRCGKLVVESGGERGQVVLDDVPKIAQLQHTLHALLDHEGPDDTATSDLRR